MEPAQRLAIICAGVFFMVGLLTGAWKYHCIRRSPEATAPPYVDILHRAALLYAFACILIERFVVLSQLDHTVELWAVIALVVFFSSAMSTYFVHGLLADTDNQLRNPHTLGRGTVPSILVSGFMVSLIIAEIGGFAVLLYGGLKELL